MAELTLQQTREEIARKEVGHTTIGRGTAWLLVFQFLLLIGVVLFSEIVRGGSESVQNRVSRLVSAVVTPLASGGSFSTRVFVKNRSIIQELERFDDEAGEQTLLAKGLRPPTQYVLAHFGAGNEKAYIGRKPWLFFRESVDYLTGPSFLETGNAVPAILDLHSQLTGRGIPLIVIPTPAKPSIHPERFSRRLEGRNTALRPVAYAAFVRDLEEVGVLVFDPAPYLFESKRESGYLMTDTHWKPEAMRAVANGLKEFIAEHVELPPRNVDYEIEEVDVTNLGDVARMLDLPDGQSRYPPETVRIRQVRSGERQTGDILLLGDSFSNIYSLGEMGWGESAGFAEQLSLLMKRPIDRIVQNADGAFATREQLARELARGRDRLAGKRVVIFQFAERELAVGEWKLVDLTLGETAPGEFFVPEAGEAVVVSGTIREVAPVPRPGTVPYADHITAMHLVDLTGEDPRAGGGQALVYIWGMRDHALQDAARFRVGDTVSVRLRPWTDVASEYDGISRTELANGEVQFEVPTWGEVIR